MSEITGKGVVILEEGITIDLSKEFLARITAIEKRIDTIDKNIWIDMPDGTKYGISMVENLKNKKG